MTHLVIVLFLVQIDTNVDYQYEILDHPDFQSGNTDVEFIERMESKAKKLDAEKRVG